MESLDLMQIYETSAITNYYYRRHRVVPAAPDTDTVRETGL